MSLGGRGCTCLKCTNRATLAHRFYVGIPLLRWHTASTLVHLRQVHPLPPKDIPSNNI